MKKNLLILFVVLSFSSFSQQWQQMNAPLLQGGYAGYQEKGIYISDSAIVIGTYYGFYRSTDLGLNWQICSNDINPTIMGTFSGFSKLNDTLYASFLTGEVYASSDKGLTWQLTSIALGNRYLFNHGNVLIQLDYSGPDYYSTDAISWNPVPSIISGIYALNDSVSTSFISGYDNNSFNYVVKNNFAIDTMPKLDLGATYNQMAAEPSSGYLYTYTNDNEIYRYNINSTDTAWTLASTFPFDPLDLAAIGSPTYSISMKATDNVVLLSLVGQSLTGNRYTKIYRSTDHASSWTELTNSGLDVPVFMALKQIDASTIIANDYQGNLLFSFDNGLNWQTRNNHFLGHYMANMLVMDNSILLNIFKNSDYRSFNGIIKSTDAGSTWNLSNNGIPALMDIEYDSVKSYHYLPIFFKQGNTVFCGRQEPVSVLYRSFDEGDNWDSIPMPTNQGYMITSIGGDDNSFIVMMSYDTVPGYPVYSFYRSSDNGTTWQIVPSILNNNYTGPAGVVGKNDTMLLVQNDNTVAPGQNKIFQSIDNGDTWTDITGNLFSNPYRIIDLGAARSNILIEVAEYASKFMAVVATRDSINYYTEEVDSLYIYESGTWTKLDGTGLPPLVDIQSIKYFNGVWALGTDQGLFSSIDSGQTWQSDISTFFSGNDPANNLRTSDFVSGMEISAIGYSGTNAFISTKANGCWIKSGFSSGIETNQIVNSAFVVYPNPTLDRINFRTEKHIDKCKIEVFDLAGKLLKTASFTAVSVGQTIEFDLSKLSAGLYFIKVNADDVLFQEKIILSK